MRLDTDGDIAPLAARHPKRAARGGGRAGRDRPLFPASAERSARRRRDELEDASSRARAAVGTSLKFRLARTAFAARSRRLSEFSRGYVGGPTPEKRRSGDVLRPGRDAPGRRGDALQKPRRQAAPRSSRAMMNSLLRARLGPHVQARVPAAKSGAIASAHEDGR